MRGREGVTSYRIETKRSVDLWTIRLRRTGALAVDNDKTVIHRAPLAHKLHRTLSVFIYFKKQNRQGEDSRTCGIRCAKVEVLLATERNGSPT